MNLPAKAATGDIMESVLIKGDLAKLTEIERVNYYNAVCKSIGLNPLTRPFDYITLNGKLQLYAKRDACDQLRKIQNISLQVVSTEMVESIYIVHVKARTPEGREDEDYGAVPLPDAVKGEFRANLILKAVTKAKRRATLSICGLGFLDETEVEDIPSAVPGRKFINPSTRDDDTQIKPGGVHTPPIAYETEHADAARSAPGSAAAGASTSPTTEAPAALSVEDMAREAARRGHEQLRKYFNKCSSADKERLRKIEAELVTLYPPLTHNGG